MQEAESLVRLLGVNPQLLPRRDILTSHSTCLPNIRAAFSNVNWTGDAESDLEVDESDCGEDDDDEGERTKLQALIQQDEQTMHDERTEADEKRVDALTCASVALPIDESMIL